MKEEIWRDVLGYEGLYQASNLGNVKSLNYNHTNKTKILKPVVVRNYLRIRLSINGKITNYQVHRVVWEAFNGPIPEGMQVNHINEDKLDNRLENLNLMTCKENINWGTASKRRSLKMINRTDQSKPVIQYDCQGNIVKDDWLSTMEIQRNLGYSNSKISDCCLGKIKSYKGYIWKYKEREAV